MPQTNLKVKQTFFLKVKTDNYRNFTFIRTYFIVVQQQHSSSKTTQAERVGVGDAPNTLHFNISYTTTPTIYLGQQQTRERLRKQGNSISMHSMYSVQYM